MQDDFTRLLSSGGSMLQGWTHKVVEHDGIMYRFQKEGSPCSLKKETELLQSLRGLPIEIPKPKWHGSFMSYKRPEGTPLRPDEASQENAFQLGEFLKALHSTKALEFAKPMSIFTEEAKLFYEQMGRIEGITPAALEAIKGALGLIMRSGYIQPLIHGDLCPENILSNNGKITGIIDWSDSQAGDPAKDFGHLFLHFGPGFTKCALDAYGDHGLLPRPVMYSFLIPGECLLDAPEWEKPEWITKINSIPVLMKLHSGNIEKLI